MRIVFVTPRPWPLKGGVESHVHNLAESIGEDADVLVLSQYLNKDAGIIKNFKPEHYDYNFFKVFGLSYYACSLKLIKEALKEAKKGSIIHLQAAHKPLSVVLLLLLGSKYKQQTIFTMHYHGGGHGRVASFVHLFYRPLLSLALKNVGQIIAVSNAEKEIIVRQFGLNKSMINVIPNGVGDVRQVKNGNEVTVISRLEKYKNIDKVIKNMPDNFKLNIVGIGAYEEYLKRMAEDNQNIKFHGELDEEKYEDIWQRTGVLISLSDKEAYGMVVAEAIARGVSVIASNIPAHSFIYEISGNNALFNFEEPELKKQISRLIMNKSDKIVGHNFFTWKAAAEMTNKAYRGSASV